MPPVFCPDNELSTVKGGTNYRMHDKIKAITGVKK